MKLCESCGTELRRGEGYCPRCGAKSRIGAAPLASGILGASCALGAAIQAVIDLSPDGSLGWSRISIVSCALAWILFGLPLVGRRRPRLVAAAMAAATLVHLWLVERWTAPGTWFLPIGLPIAAVSLVVAAAVAYATARARRKGPNVAAFILVGAAAICVAVDLILALTRGSGPLLSWSLIALAASLPVAVLLLDLQKRIRGSRTIERA